MTRQNPRGPQPKQPSSSYQPPRPRNCFRGPLLCPQRGRRARRYPILSPSDARPGAGVELNRTGHHKVVPTRSARRVRINRSQGHTNSRLRPMRFSSWRECLHPRQTSVARSCRPLGRKRRRRPGRLPHWLLSWQPPRRRSKACQRPRGNKLLYLKWIFRCGVCSRPEYRFRTCRDFPMQGSGVSRKGCGR